MKTFYKAPKYDGQLATAHALLMACGSLFKDCECSPHKERNTYLHYAEMQDWQKDDLEREIAKRLDWIRPGFLKKLGGLKCQVLFGWEGERLIVRFDTGGFEALECSVGGDGKFEIHPAHPTRK